MWLTRFALSRPTVTWVIFGTLVVFGLVSYIMLGRSSNPPNTDYPLVIVYASYPGASPQDMERMVIKPIEDQMNGIEYLDQLTATAQEGTAVVGVQFNVGTNLDLAAVEVQRRVDTARIYMPTDMDPPEVDKAGTSEPPLLDIAVSSASLTQPQIADLLNAQVTPIVEGDPDVQSVDVYGAATREFHVEPNPAALDATGATLEDIFNAVSYNNLNVPGGILTQPTREGTVAIHAYINQASDLLGIPLSPTTVLQYPVKALKIGDVAQAYDSHIEMRSISSYNGRPRVYMAINPTLDADQIRATQGLRTRLKTIQAQFPQLHFNEIDAPADYTAKMLTGVGQSLVEGIILTAIVMLLFLHAWRNAVVVFLAIPSSILSTFILMKIFGFHIDSMSMMGLSLIIGILVDDSIVVLENITRHRDMGEDPMNAAINGRTEIGAAAIAITMVDVIVFLPIAFLSGIVGAYLREYAVVVVTATLFSLFVSFTLTPLLAAKWSVVKRSEATPRWLLALDNRRVDVALLALAVVMFAVGTLTGWVLLSALGIFIVALLILNAFVHRYEAIVNAYHTKFLPFALRHGAFVVFVCVALLLNSFTLLAGGMATITVDALLLVVCAVTHVSGALLRRHLPAPHLAQWYQALPRFVRSIGSNKRVAVATFCLPVVLAIAMLPLGAVSTSPFPAQQTGEISMTVTYPPGTPIAVTNRFVSHLEAAIMRIDGVKSVSATVGRKPSGFSSVTGGNYAQLSAAMREDRIKQTNATIAKIRRLGYLVPGAEFDVAGDSGGGGGGSDIQYAVTGPDAAIGPAAEKLAAYIRSLPGTVNVQTSAESGAPRLNVDVDRAKCEILGVSPADVAQVARIAVDGAVATRVRTPTGLVDVRVQFPLADRENVAQLENVKVRSNDGSLVPIGDVASFTWTTAPTKIERLNRQRVVNVYGDLLPGYSLGQVEGPLQKKLAQPGFLPAGVALVSQGNSKLMSEAFLDMGIALVASFALVYVLMVILYGSFLEPFIVMCSVPLAIIGALIFLALMARLEPQQGQSLNIVSVLGVIMLFGLVAKNGILLVDYSNTMRKRGLRVHDAVLQAAAIRFRPIVMTTAAMIFGMLPLALGYAEGGEWRQAIGTVIIGGLLSSLILTLFLVPMLYNTWMGALERRADRHAVQTEMEPVPS
ncbi:MAG: efflux RND transporter permease subunit [Candidatus Tyrphobacter sp.]